MQEFIFAEDDVLLKFLPQEDCVGKIAGGI